MRKVLNATILSLLIGALAPGAFASEPPLVAGKPAGVKKAQDQDVSTPLLVFGAAAVGIGIALAVSDDGDAATPSVPSTTSVTTTTAP